MDAAGVEPNSLDWRDRTASVITGLRGGRAFAILAVVGALLPATMAVAATTLTLSPLADATLFQEGDTASGADDGFFAGINGNTGGFVERRGLIQFDVSAIPNGAVIQQVTLTLNVTRTAHAGAVTNSLSRVTQSWGEGTSTAPRGGGAGGTVTPGSATWNYRFWNTTPWAAPGGGDFVVVPSASTSVGDVGAYSWSSAALKDDVQSWVQVPSDNHGWILIAGGPPGTTSAKRFASREFADPAQRPVLSVTYDFSGNGGDAPLPLWADIALALSLVGVMAVRRGRSSDRWC
jgi:hypothetical protein